MDRGRPKKRADGTIIKSAETKASEQKAFESLPQGIKATDASSLYSNAEMDMLRKQAIGQAAKFEVLNSKDVERLSRVSPHLFSLHAWNIPSFLPNPGCCQPY
jgi:hypothetical protein